MIKATSQFKGQNDFPDESFSLVIGQATGDSSLIFDGKQHNLSDFQDVMEKKFWNVPHNIYFKRHPSQMDAPFPDCMDRLGVEDVQLGNMYDLLSNDNLCTLYSVSSGTLQEAYYFNKDTHYFKESIYNYVKDDLSVNTLNVYVNALHHPFRPYLWMDLLGIQKSDLISQERYDEFGEGIFLRKRLNAYWSYKNL